MSVKLLIGAVLLNLGLVLAHPYGYGYNVCYDHPYKELLPLSHYPPAQSYCAVKYPKPPCTSTKHVTAKTTKIITRHATQKATVTTGYSTDLVHTATTASYIYTTTVVETSTTTTSTATTYTATSVETVYTNSRYPVEYTKTFTEYTVTGTDVDTVTVATLPTTVITGTTITTSTIKTTTTVSSGTKTVTTNVDHGLRKRTAAPEETNEPTSGPCRRGYPPPPEPSDLFKKLKRLQPNKIETACSCLKLHPTCKTVTSTRTSTATSYTTVTTVKTQSVGGVKTVGDVSTELITTDTTTTTSVGYTTTKELLQIDTTSIEYVSTVSTDTTTTLPTNTVTSTSVTAYSTTNIVTTTTFTTTSTASQTVPVTTTTVVVDFHYSLVYGPADGCAYSPDTWIDQTSSNMPNGATQADRVAFCAAWCDTVANCKTFGMNDFPPCGPNGDYVYCLASANTWGGTSKLQCGIGTAWNGCSIYQDDEFDSRM
ncbi:hypothetical protein EDB80DRAFT_896812 [Ilyonectria destructans]|nr:hypothetical protein EDB80DRAFT_896812 [Ilyonectria destructans]